MPKDKGKYTLDSALANLKRNGVKAEELEPASLFKMFQAIFNETKKVIHVNNRKIGKDTWGVIDYLVKQHKYITVRGS